MRAAGAFAAVLAACAGAPPAVLPAAPIEDGWVTFHVRFEPALAAAGELLVLHESGVRLELSVGRTGLELRLPPGPASLRLDAGGKVIEQPIVVERGADVVVEVAR